MLYNVSIKFIAGGETPLASRISAAEVSNLLSSLKRFATELFKNEFGDKKKLTFGEVQPHLSKDIVHITSIGGMYSRLYAIISITPDTNMEVTHDTKENIASQTGELPLPEVREIQSELWS